MSECKCEVLTMCLTGNGNLAGECRRCDRFVFDDELTAEYVEQTDPVYLRKISADPEIAPGSEAAK